MLVSRSRLLIAFTLAGLSALAACQRGDDAGPAATAPASAEPPAPGGLSPPADVEPPEGVLRAYVWQCDDGLTLRMKNLYRENAVTVEMHEGPRKLPQAASASGAKYSDGSLTFWNKGATATFQRGDAPSVACRELRAESLLADARERGVLYRGTGNEPGWIAEIGADGGILFVTDYGQARHEFPGPTQQGGVAGGDIVYAGADGADRIRVIIRKEPCFDDMSGEEFDHRVVVEHGGRELRGCATVPR